MITRRFPFVVAALVAISVTFLNASQVTAQQWYNPDSPGTNKRQAQADYSKGMQSFSIGDYVTAVGYLKKAQNNDAGNKQIIHMLALAYAESGDTYNAMLQFGAALSLDYNYVECRNNYGMFLRKTGKIQEAQKAFEETIKINPKYADAHYHLGEILREKGDLDNAIECFHAAIRANPNYFDALQDLGLAMYDKYSSGLCDISESLEKLQQAAQLIPDNPMIHYYLGNIYCSQSLFDQAEAAYRKALQCDAKLSAAHYEFGKLRYYRGDVDRCILEMREAEKINPVYAESKKYPKVDPQKMNEYKGAAFEVKGLLIEAVDSLKEASSMQRNNAETLKKISALEKTLRAGTRRKKGEIFDMDELQALIKRGVGQIEEGDYEGAKKTFGRVLEMNPECYEGVQHLGELAEISGDLNGAMTKYQQAQLLRPQFDGALFNLGVVLEKMNLPGDAGMMYQRFHELAGRYPYDPRHVVAIMQGEVRRRERDFQIKKRGY